MSGHDRTGL